MPKNLFVYFLLWMASIWHVQGRYSAKSVKEDYDIQATDHENHYEIQYKPYPYDFGYEIKHPSGEKQYHKEEGDHNNVKKGSYGYTDAYGIYRHVEYIADHEGFRVVVKTNEPGTASTHPANAHYIAEPSPSHLYAYQQDTSGHGSSEEEVQYDHEKVPHQYPVHQYVVPEYRYADEHA